MNDINIKLKDKFTVEDKIGPKGIVTLRDGDKIIFRKENLITNKGRETVLGLFLNSIFNGITKKEITISGLELGIGSGGSITTGNLTELENEIISVPVLSASEDDVNAIITYLESEISFSINYTFSDIKQATVIQELGLYLSNGENRSLFSRVVFDPIPVDPNSNYTVEYNVYF